MSIGLWCRGSGVQIPSATPFPSPVYRGILLAGSRLVTDWSHTLWRFVLCLFDCRLKGRPKLLHHRFLTIGHHVTIDVEGDRYCCVTSAATNGGDGIPHQAQGVTSWAL